MNKRSAMLIAAGLVLTLGIGGLAVSLGLTGPAAVNAADAARAERVVRVERRTVTVDRTADAAAGAATQMSLSSPTSVDPDDVGEDHGSEDDHGFDDQDEAEDD
jgi:hypothetical protein